MVPGDREPLLSIVVHMKLEQSVIGGDRLIQPKLVYNADIFTLIASTSNTPPLHPVLSFSLLTIFLPYSFLIQSPFASSSYFYNHSPRPVGLNLVLSDKDAQYSLL